jgi:hypothetical protein
MKEKKLLKNLIYEIQQLTKNPNIDCVEKLNTIYFLSVSYENQIKD